MLNKVYFSNVHQCKINVQDSMNFLTEIIMMNMTYHEVSYFKNHYNPMKEIAFGSKVWVNNETLSHDILLFKTYLHRYWIPFPS